MKALQDLNRKNSQKSLEARKAIHSTNDTQTIPFNQISSSVERLFANSFEGLPRKIFTRITRQTTPLEKRQYTTETTRTVKYCHILGNYVNLSTSYDL